MSDWGIGKTQQGPAQRVSVINADEIGGSAVPDGSNATLGAIDDAQVTTSVPATISSKLRGLVSMLREVRDLLMDRLPSTLTADTNMRVAVMEVALPEEVFSGQNTVASAGTAEALAALQELKSGVTVKALTANTGNIYVGNSLVSSANGFVLDAGELVFIETGNVHDIHIDAGINGEGVSWIAS